MKSLVLGALALAIITGTPAFAKDLTPVGNNSWGGGFTGTPGRLRQESNRTGCGDLGADLDIADNVIDLLTPPGAHQFCAGTPPWGDLQLRPERRSLRCRRRLQLNPSEMFLMGVQLDGYHGITGNIDPDGAFGGTARVNALLTATAKAGAPARVTYLHLWRGRRGH